MRCLNTPLPSSFHPAPPHTWDGHFISECSKWKGDLNLPCSPPSSISHTQNLIPLMAHCWLPELSASTPNLVIERAGFALVYYLEEFLFFSKSMLFLIFFSL